jgi:hypothetical protein
VRQDGTALSGVTVQLDDSATTTDANGYYSFAEVAAGETYTITPISTDFTFTPTSATVANLSSNQTANFTGQQTDFLLAGSVKDENGIPLDGVTVTLGGATTASTSTDAQGKFRFFDLPTGGSYTITVSKHHYSFVHGSQTLSNPTGM